MLLPLTGQCSSHPLMTHSPYHRSLSSCAFYNIIKKRIIYRYNLFSFPVGGAGSATERSRKPGSGELLLWRWKLWSKCHGLEFLFGLFPVLFLLDSCSLCSLYLFPCAYFFLFFVGYLSRFVFVFCICCYMYFWTRAASLLSNNFNLLLDMLTT